MNLEHIKDTVCPNCGAEVTAESRDHRHTNGHWNERRTFACGLQLHYSPNFRCVRLASPFGRAEEENFACMCRKDPRRLAATAREDTAKENLRSYLQDADIPEYLRQRWLASFRLL